MKILEFLRSPNTLLALLCALFLLKGLVFVSIIPMHQGSDEYVHYATVQYLAEPKEKTWPIEEQYFSSSNTKDISRYHYTEEIRAFSRLTDSKSFSGAPYNTQNLSPEEVTRVETEMRSGAYPPVIQAYPPTIVPGSQLSHWLGSFLERLLSTRDAFDRYFSIRTLAVLFGLVTIVTGYFTSLFVGFTRHQSLLIAGIIAFQPQFGATTAIINYDPLLIASYSLVLLGAVSVLRHGLNLWNALAMILFSFVAVFTKGIGGILFFLTAGILLLGFRERIAWLNRLSSKKSVAILLVAFLTIFLMAPDRYTSILTEIPKESRGKSALESFVGYLDGGVFDSGKIERTAATYWGTFGWLDTTIHPALLDVLQALEWIALLGCILFALHALRHTRPFQWLSTRSMRGLLKKFFVYFQTTARAFTQNSHIPDWLRVASSQISSAWRTMWSKKDFLPEGKYLALLFVSLFLLQGAVRFYDWYGRYVAGEGVGTPGRYFLPNIIPHFILLATGLGVFCRSSRAFTVLLRVLFAGMALVSLYAIFWIIIPRYYL